MKHRDVFYDAEYDENAEKWFWKLYPKIGHGQREFGPPEFNSREAALAACPQEIDKRTDGWAMRQYTRTGLALKIRAKIPQDTRTRA
jgi:hypothetical protein